jgi:hypothetical protein
MSVSSSRTDLCKQKSFGPCVKKYGTRGLRDRVSPPMTALAGRLWPAGRDRRQLCLCRLRLGLGRLRQLGLGRCPPLFVCAAHHAPRVRAHDARTMQAAGRCRHARRELSARQRRAGTRPARPTLHACAACADHASHQICAACAAAHGASGSSRKGAQDSYDSYE